MAQPFRQEDLIDKLLLVETLNSTLIHFVLSTQAEGVIDPDKVDSLIQALTKTRVWLEETINANGIPPSTSNILSLIVKRLSQLESLLPRVSQRAKEVERSGAAQEIISILEGSPKAASQVTRAVTASAAAPAVAAQEAVSTPGTGTEQAPSSQSDLVPLVKAPELPRPEPFKKVEIEDDEFGLISQTQHIIQQKRNQAHILLPVFWLEVLKEVHRYRSESAHFGDAVEVPGQIVAKIVRVLLTEAPGARLLQDLLKYRNQESTLEPSEIDRVERAVSKYYHGLEELLSGKEVILADKIAEAQNALDGFGWGGPELEKRLIKRIYQQCQETLQEALSVTDVPRQVICAETVKLLCKLQHAVLAEPRLQAILAEMKP
ncbi:MAG: hypothetical protein HXY34_02150 [Candidatus Thorarchaeota archaeon]|nr:hypothetical protein [Candidatus Thorarchaeota archaeon]